VPALFEQLITRLTERMSGVINGFDDTLDEIEAALTTTDPIAARRTIRESRQDILILRRYMAPQRDAVTMLHADPPKWLSEIDRLRLRETANRLMQYVEELDAARERAGVLDDSIGNQMSEKMNKTCTSSQSSQRFSCLWGSLRDCSASMLEEFPGRKIRTGSCSRRSVLASSSRLRLCYSSC
jgi:hypothetical protein